MAIGLLLLLTAALLPAWVWLGHPRDWAEQLPSLRRFGRSLCNARQARPGELARWALGGAAPTTGRRADRR